MESWLRFITIMLMLHCLVMPRLSFSQDSIELSSEIEETPQTIDEFLLFLPEKYPSGNWQPKALDFRDVYFTAEDNTKLHGWFCPSSDPQGVLLVLHGNAGHVASRAGWLSYLQQQAKLTVFVFDYRGYGRSEGTPTVEGVLQDARAARAKLLELANVKDSEMLLMGESLGGAIAVQLASESAPRGLILQSTFSSLRDIADVHFPKVSWLVAKDKLDSTRLIARYRGPLLQSHGGSDRTIPISLGKKLFAAANEPKQFFTVEKSDHNDWITSEYLRALNDFVDSVARGK